PLEGLEETIIQTLQKFVESEEPEEEAVELSLPEVSDEASEGKTSEEAGATEAVGAAETAGDVAQEDAEVAEDVLTVHEESEKDKAEAIDGDAPEEAKDES
ncbi:MAG: hypothetical protein QF592_02370, partial [Alphaproteobacteria bacterium]|nr:hypothetical protein [Alphaproteobacteria bacterium]